ncbi:helix-turn-helix transcriptional regulator [Ruegeria arenilitoris]|uniref:helix-turn-helix transcriptional regulator n=1 Tax=Ruegeria arenilitoris TaxID=1173585 RepID=UPI00147C7D49
MSDPAQQSLCSTAEAAEFLGISPASLNRLRRSHDGPPAIRINARVFLYRRCDLATWIRRRTQIGPPTNSSDRGRECSTLPQLEKDIEK